MSFYKYLLKRISLAFLGIFITITFSYVILAIFINYANQSILSGYFNFLHNIFHHFGTFKNDEFNSFSSPLALFFNYYKHSVFLVGVTFFISIFLGFLIGVFLAYKNNTWSEVLLNILIFVFAAIPTFIIAPLMLIFAEFWDLPVNYIEPSILGIGYTALSLLLPIILLSLTSIAYFATVTKNSMIVILKKDYVQTLKACGQSEHSIFWKCIFKNLVISLLNTLTPLLILTISFSLIIERIFQIPGQSLILTTMFSKDELNVIMALIFFKSLVLFIFDLICEVLHDALQVDNKLNLYYTIRIPNAYKLLRKEAKDE